MRLIIILLVILGSNWCLSQERENFSKHHNISVLLSHTYVSKGVVDSEREWLILPSVALDYNFVFSKGELEKPTFLLKKE